MRITGQNPQLAATRLQLMHQLNCARSRLRGLGQFKLMAQQPSMFGRRLSTRQGGQMVEDVVAQRNVQGPLDRLKIMHGHRQGAVHVEHPIPVLLPH